MQKAQKERAFSRGELPQNAQTKNLFLDFQQSSVLRILHKIAAGRAGVSPSPNQFMKNFAHFITKILIFSKDTV